MLLYVDDMLLIGSFLELVCSLIQVLSREFSIKDLGPIHHFLSIEISPTTNELHLLQTHYAYSIIDHVQMFDYQLMPMPLGPRLLLLVIRNL